MRKMTTEEKWKLSDELSVIDAAILITGNDPETKHEEYVGEGFSRETVMVQTTEYDGFEAVFKALKNAIFSNKLRVSAVFPVVENPDYNSRNGGHLTAMLRNSSHLFEMRQLNVWKHDALVYLKGEPDWSQSTIEVEDLKDWLKKRHVFPSMFFPVGNPDIEADPDNFMNPNHPRYSAKLACAVAAWKAVTDAGKNKTPKQTIEAWVTNNGVRFGLPEVVGATALEEISKVANWQTQGGAVKTGGQVDETLPPLPKATPDNYKSLVATKDKDTGATWIDPLSGSDV
ncbi:hypothetical protein IFT84_13140 [Rhizobium sp. CFBP 8762]|uniref:hypothetical protein n=1 Tax=Rhizobium sp. CFBP 8762 TaxID=2775279 RepID=UPI0017807D23|nr:hypothetical protein [Rhizobium sp. CFBP 8762]MBD8555450.1 hypothetical protein [Rhizobium sp. CFBP 8762]